jgi:hypothetical protein
MACLYLMGLDLSNEQIAEKLDLPINETQAMTSQLREGIVAKKPVTLSGEAKTDEVYIIAGHKSQPEVVANLGRKGRRRRLRGKRGRGTLKGEKPPVLGMLQRNGEVVIQMVSNVLHVTIKPLINETIAPGSMPEMRMAMAFMKYLSTPWKAFRPCFALGCVRIVAFLRKSCPGN